MFQFPDFFSCAGTVTDARFQHGNVFYSSRARNHPNVYDWFTNHIYALPTDLLGGLGTPTFGGFGFLNPTVPTYGGLGTPTWGGLGTPTWGGLGVMPTVPSYGGWLGSPLTYDRFNRLVWKSHYQPHHCSDSWSHDSWSYALYPAGSIYDYGYAFLRFDSIRFDAAPLTMPSSRWFCINYAFSSTSSYCSYCTDRCCSDFYRPIAAPLIAPTAGSDSYRSDCYCTDSIVPLLSLRLLLLPTPSCSDSCCCQLLLYSELCLREASKAA